MNKLIVPAVIVAAGMVGLTACGPVKAPAAAPPTTQTNPATATPTPSARTAPPKATTAPKVSSTPIVATPAPTTATTAPTTCQSVNGLPDPLCTPGAANPAVTQANIYSTICKSGWAESVRPPESYTEPLKATQLTEYGNYAGSSLGNYEEDHLIPLEVGGSPTSPQNLWPEAHAGTEGSYVKDGVEDALNHAVCSGRVKLVPAQEAIASNWTTAEGKLGLS
jgi:hypothetical protein